MNKHREVVDVILKAPGNFEIFVSRECHFVENMDYTDIRTMQELIKLEFGFLNYKINNIIRDGCVVQIT